MTEPDIQLRTASVGDLDAFYRLYAQVQSIHAEAEPEFFRPPEMDETVQRYFDGVLGDPNQHLVFACIGDAEVGFIEYFLGNRPRDNFRPERRVGYIHGLIVDETHRGTGCAAVLIEHVKEAARQQDITLLGIDFWSFNDKARACFEKAGFTVGKEFMWQSL